MIEISDKKAMKKKISKSGVITRDSLDLRLCMYCTD